MKDFTTQAADVETGAESGAWPEATAIPKLAEDALADWKETTRLVRETAQARGLSRPAIAKEAGVSAGVLYPWLDGTYKGSFANVTKSMRKWLNASDARVETRATMLREPDYVETPTAREVMSGLMYAQNAPGIALITLGPGMGKTTCSKEYIARTPHAFRVVMRPSTGSVHSMLREIASALGVVERDPGKLARAIGDKLKRNGRHTLLIVDEAQNLSESAVNELRYFHDEYGAGIAMLGNEDIHARYGGLTPREGYGQIHRRIGFRMRRMQPGASDIDAFVDAWQLEDSDAVKITRAIGKKPGALGQIKETLKLASVLAGGRGAALTAEDIRRAWINRGGEEIR